METTIQILYEIFTIINEVNKRKSNILEKYSILGDNDKTLKYIFDNLSSYLNKFETTKLAIINCLELNGISYNNSLLEYYITIKPKINCFDSFTHFLSIKYVLGNKNTLGNINPDMNLSKFINSQKKLVVREDSYNSTDSYNKIKNFKNQMQYTNNNLANENLIYDYKYADIYNDNLPPENLKLLEKTFSSKLETDNSIKNEPENNIDPILFLAKITEENLFQLNLVLQLAQSSDKFSFTNLGNIVNSDKLELADFIKINSYFSNTFSNSEIKQIFSVLDINEDNYFTESDFKSNFYKVSQIITKEKRNKNDDNIEVKWYTCKKEININEEVLINILIKMAKIEKTHQQNKLKLLEIYSIDQIFYLLSENKGNETFISISSLSNFLKRINILSGKTEVNILFSKIKNVSFLPSNSSNSSSNKLTNKIDILNKDLIEKDNSNKGKILYNELIWYFEPQTLKMKNIYYNHLETKSFNKVNVELNSEVLFSFFNEAIILEVELNKIKKKFISDNNLNLKEIYCKILSYQENHSNNIYTFKNYVNLSVSETLNSKTNPFKYIEVLNDDSNMLLMNRFLKGKLDNIKYEEFLNELYPINFI